MSSPQSSTFPPIDQSLPSWKPFRLLKYLFPILPRTTSSTLRAFIRKTIISDIRTANMRSKNHKLNRAVQAMLFGMVERGMEGEVLGDKGKARAATGPTTDRTAHNGEEAMWAVILTKELWKKGIWFASQSSYAPISLNIL
jgi:protein SDA1